MHDNDAKDVPQSCGKTGNVDEGDDYVQGIDTLPVEEEVCMKVSYSAAVRCRVVSHSTCMSTTYVFVA